METKMHKKYVIKSGLFLNDSKSANIGISRDFLDRKSISNNAKSFLPILFYKINGVPFTQEKFIEEYLNSKRSEEKIYETRAKEVLEELVKSQLIYEVYMKDIKEGTNYGI